MWSCATDSQWLMGGLRAALFWSAVATASSKQVGIFYWTWFKDAWGFGTWGTPQLGKYDSNDVGVIDQHTEWLRGAGVDFVIMDWSNNCKPYGDPDNPNMIEDGTRSFVRRQSDRKSQGKSYLQFAIMLGTCGHPENLSNGAIYAKAEQLNSWFLQTEFNGLWWRYRTVPLIGLFAATLEQQAEAFNHPAFWTRVMGAGLSGRGLVDGSFKSRYLTYEDRWEPYPSYETLYGPGTEQQTVQVACRSPGGWTQPDHRRCREGGQTFRDWWQLARNRNVDWVLVHSWNQWGGPGEELSQECSTDIEPMSGGHGDAYLTLLREEVALFKSSANLTAVLV